MYYRESSPNANFITAMRTNLQKQHRSQLTQPCVVLKGLYLWGYIFEVDPNLSFRNLWYKLNIFQSDAFYQLFIEL